MTRFAAILFGAALLCWPALINRYPILFSDTHAFLIQAGDVRMIWDKPFAYGLFLRLLDLGISLWLPMVAQALLVSGLLWQVAARFSVATPARHGLICIILAAGSALPWVTDLMMPDIFAPVTVLALFLIAGGAGWPMIVLAAFAIASHLSHLVLAAACCAMLLIRPPRRWQVLAPLVLALAWLAATNVYFIGRLAISPYGSVFAMARLAGDGIVDKVLARHCPRPDWTLCAWQGRLSPDHNHVLWDPDGPVWSHAGGAIGIADEARAVGAAAIAEFPAAVASAAISNTIRQLGRVEIGDALIPDGLEGGVTNSLTQYFAPGETARFRSSRQAQDGLRAWAEPLNLPHAMLLGLGTLATIIFAARGRGGFAALVLAALVANAFATGALSGPHDRYQARIAWLVLLPPLLMRRGGLQPDLGPSAPTARSH